jgi:hypothetical protein
MSKSEEGRECTSGDGFPVVTGECGYIRAGSRRRLEQRDVRSRIMSVSMKGR